MRFWKSALLAGPDCVLHVSPGQRAHKICRMVLAKAIGLAPAQPGRVPFSEPKVECIVDDTVGH